MTDGFQTYQQPEQAEKCSLCGADETHIWIGGPDQPSPDDLLLCDACYGWSQRISVGTDQPKGRD